MKVKFESTMHKQRFVLGVICGLLPICCILFGLFGLNVNPQYWWYSISATYYATSSPWMIGSLCLASFFFLTYQGYDLGDKWLTNISGITAILIVLFPCKIDIYNYVGMFQLPTNLSSIIHNSSAAILFSSFALMILLQFTKGSDKRRNTLYRVCGFSILFAAMLLGVSNAFHLPGYMTVICEFIMLEAFAIAWIAKSKATFHKEIKS